MKVLIALPVYNEEFILAQNVQVVLDFCQKNLIGDDFIIVIANNNSTDQTAQIAHQLSSQNQKIEYLFIPQKGKGLAIASAWLKYEADLYCFMDIDLATDLSALPRAIDKIKAGADLVIGSRFHPKSQVKRSYFRRFVSYSYKLFFKSLFNLQINDFPCGFKIISRQARDLILPNILNTGFFWDTEMLVLADRQGLSIVEIPIIWQEFLSENRKSRVNIAKTSLSYIKESIKLKIRLSKN
ncbi:MAG: glycosyltransferase [Candidatus Buchananbacteria bacterium]|nr:glycosyltransferase [Candidatus Buchananbacteria bacterium]